LLSARTAGKIEPAHHALAAVVEIVHMATLVHDDVLDEADERRRRPTIRLLAGNIGAVLLGDYLISHAFHLCSGVGRHASRKIGAAANRVCEGELLQNVHAGDLDLSESTYLEMIRRKTAALTAVSCELGAHYAGADDDATAALRGFGESAGIAFQIMDDVLDITGESSLMGKTLGRDQAGGKPTLPVIHALAASAPPVRAELRDVLSRATDADRSRLRSLLDDLGGIDYAVTAARAHVHDALRHLDAFPASDARASLAAMAEFILRRAY
jgi:octaprenyl-diphosphate synthase